MNNRILAKESFGGDTFDMITILPETKNVTSKRRRLNPDDPTMPILIPSKNILITKK